MKRPILIACLVLLGGCLFLTSFALQKQTAPEKPAEPASNKPAGLPPGTPVNKKAAMQDMKLRLQKEAAQRKADEAKGIKTKPKDPLASQPFQPDLSANWDQHRSDGDEGAEKIIKKRANAPEATMQPYSIRTQTAKGAEPSPPVLSKK